MRMVELRAVVLHVLDFIQFYCGTQLTVVVQYMLRSPTLGNPV